MITIERRLPNGSTISTTIDEGMATDMLSEPSGVQGCGARLTLMEPRPLTEAERALQDQCAVASLV